MACITITTTGVPAFTDPVWETVEVGVDYAKFNIKSTNVGTARGYPYIDITINDTYDQSKSMPAVNPGEVSVLSFYRGMLSPGTSYKFCATIATVTPS